MNQRSLTPSLRYGPPESIDPVPHKQVVSIMRTFIQLCLLESKSIEVPSLHSPGCRCLICADCLLYRQHSQIETCKSTAYATQKFHLQSAALNLITLALPEDQHAQHKLRLDASDCLSQSCLILKRRLSVQDWGVTTNRMKQSLQRSSDRL